MRQDATQYVNGLIMRQASGLVYTISHEAPSTECDLFNTSSLVIWSGASDNTIFFDASVNYAFRALHDALHLKTRLNFDPIVEVELGRIQASQYDSDLMRELVYSEVSLQALHFAKTGQFVSDQTSFTLRHLKNRVF